MLVSIIFCGCDMKNTGVDQEYMGKYLVTIAKYKHETVWQKLDHINLNTNDSIKLIRHKEAKKWLNKFQTIDDIHSH